jgi:large subunit ribosomal protein L6
MSRIGKMPIKVPSGVKITIKENEITVEGPKGKLQRKLHPDMQLSLEGDTLKVTRPSENREHRALHGLTRTLVANMVEGVTKGYERGLEIVGVGYKAEKSGEKILLRVGFSRQMEVVPLPGISLAVEGVNKIKVSGIDKETVGQMAASIRGVRPPDAYKGKGIRYADEKIKLKPGKAGKAIGKKE